MNADLFPLALRLAELSKSKRLRWTPTGAHEQYAIEMKSGAIVLDRFDGGVWYRLQVMNSNGDIVGALQASSPEDEYEPDDAYMLLRELFDNAYEAHYRVNETLTSLLRELRDLDG